MLTFSLFALQMEALLAYAQYFCARNRRRHVQETGSEWRHPLSSSGNAQTAERKLFWINNKLWVDVQGLARYCAEEIDGALCARPRVYASVLVWARECVCICVWERVVEGIGMSCWRCCWRICACMYVYVHVRERHTSKISCWRYRQCLPVHTCVCGCATEREAQFLVEDFMVYVCVCVELCFTEQGKRSQWIVYVHPRFVSLTEQGKKYWRRIWCRIFARAWMCRREREMQEMLDKHFLIHVLMMCELMCGNSRAGAQVRECYVLIYWRDTEARNQAVEIHLGGVCSLESRVCPVGKIAWAVLFPLQGRILWMTFWLPDSVQALLLLLAERRWFSWFLCLCLCAHACMLTLCHHSFGTRIAAQFPHYL